MNIIDNITLDAKREAEVIRAISKFIPQAECIRSWTSYDSVEGIETKEIHWGFNFLGHEIEIFTSNNGKLVVNADNKYMVSYWWAADNGRITTSSPKPLNKWETYINEKMLEIFINVSDRRTPKWALSQSLTYGRYHCHAKGAEIICMDETTGKTTRLFHTPFGNMGWDVEFPFEIRKIVERSFVRKK